MLNPDRVLDVFCPVPDEAKTFPVPTKAFSVRLPEPLVAYIDEMTQITGLSRNAMTIYLLDWGVQYVLQTLPPDLGKRVLAAYGDGFGYVASDAND